MLARGPKGHRFCSRSGHRPGLQARSLSGGREKQVIDVPLAHRCFSPSLPVSPKINLKYKINSRWITAPNVSGKTIKHLEENIRENHYGLGLGKAFLVKIEKNTRKKGILDLV